jgi:predicted nuclease of predicted toxin-antitoxin system
VKLLFDENLSPFLAGRLRDVFPDSTHVDHLGLGSADDEQVWLAARKGDYAIITKDADFQDLSTLRGAPPKVVWIRRGNCSSRDVEEILRRHAGAITDCLANPECTGLMLY